jgi:hypothetical protein
MNDFKVGDEIWWFEYPDQCMGLLRDVVLKHANVIQGWDDKYIELDCGHSLHIFDVQIFRSKSEAIDAMIARLQELRDEPHRT